MQRVLIIGGAGKQAASVYLPIVLDNNRDDIQLAAIADLTNPYDSRFTIPFSTSIHTNNTAWIALTDDIDTNFIALNEYLTKEQIDTLIVSCPPQFHHAYIQWGIQSGLDVICDKPLVARTQQFGNASASNLLLQDFESLYQSLNQSKHLRDTNRSCKAYVLLMRPVSHPYIEILTGLHDVFDLTGQCLTYALVCRSDGTYRFADEYDRPGTHGYRHGLGKLTRSGYHYIDFLAHCLTQAPPSSQVLEARMVSRSTVKDSRRTPPSIAYERIIGHTYDVPSRDDFTGDNAELDFNITYSLRTGDVPIPDCEIHFSFVERGCTRRVNPYYPKDTTHDEGQTHDTVICIHQGPLQSFHLLVAYDAINAGRASLVRRLNPKVAMMLDQPSLTISDVQLQRDENTIQNRDIARDLLDVLTGRQAVGRYSSLDLREHRTTMKLYALAIGAECGPCSSQWGEDSV